MKGSACTRDSWTDSRLHHFTECVALQCTVHSVPSQIHITCQSVSLQARYYAPQPGCFNSPPHFDARKRRVLLTLNSLITPPPHPLGPQHRTPKGPDILSFFFLSFFLLQFPSFSLLFNSFPMLSSSECDTLDRV